MEKRFLVLGIAVFLGAVAVAETTAPSKPNPPPSNGAQSQREASAPSLPAGPSALPQILSSTTEQIQEVPMTAGAPYTYWTAYAVTVPDLGVGDIVFLFGQFEVTTSYNFDIQVDRYIGRGECFGTCVPTALSPPSGSNITLDIHHLRDTVIAVDTSQSGTMTYSVVLEAASTTYQSGDHLQVEAGYGGLWALVFRAYHSSSVPSLAAR